MDERRAGGNVLATVSGKGSTPAGDGGTGFSHRNRRLRRRLRHVLRSDDEVDIAFVMSMAPSVAAGPGDAMSAGAAASTRRWGIRQRRALATTCGGAVVVARLTKPTGAELVQRFETEAQLGTSNVAPGDSYIDVAGCRYWVHGVWTYSLYQLHSRRASADASSLGGAIGRCRRARLLGPDLPSPPRW